MGLCQDYAAIWPAEEQDTAQAVCEAESGGQACAQGDFGRSIGLWQTYTPAHPDVDPSRLCAPAYNAQQALAIWQSSGWGAWSTYTEGTYRRYLTGSPIAPGQQSDSAG